VDAAAPDAGAATDFEIAPTPEGETFGGPTPELDFSRPDLSAGEAATPEPPAPAPEGDTAAEDATGPLDIDVGIGDGVAPDEASPPGDQGVAIDSAVAAALEAAPASAAGGVAVDFDFDTEVVEVVEGADILEEIDVGSAGPPPRSLDFEPLVPAPAPPAPPEIARQPERTSVAPPAPEAVAPPAPPAAAIAPSPPAAAPPAAAPVAAAPAPAAQPETPSSCVLAGSHRVVVHTVEGTVKRGTLADPDLAAATLPLGSPAGGAPEDVPTEKVKAIFFMLAPGEKPPLAQGKKVRVTFRDGRQVAGFSPDYSETAAGFFMIPGDTRTNTGRIWVYRAAVRQVAVS
jgi:hypothetical protein